MREQKGIYQLSREALRYGKEGKPINQKKWPGGRQSNRAGIGADIPPSTKREYERKTADTSAHIQTTMEYIQMTDTTQHLYRQNLNDLLDQVSHHHCALLRSKKFSGHLTVRGDSVDLVIDEADEVILARKFDLTDKHVMERLRGTINTMQEIMPAASALVPHGGAA